jgi:glycosyltransferase involved in cell wall biosynthesis
MWPEAFGMSALEALAAGCAVVASQTGGLSDIIHHGRTGLLVPPGDPAALATAVNTLLADPGLARGLASAGRLLARTFTMAAHAEAVFGLYQEAVVRHARKMSNEGPPATPISDPGTVAFRPATARGGR